MDYGLLAACPLFEGITPRELPDAVGALSPVVRDYEKNQTVLMQGDPPCGIGLLLTGTGLVVKDDFWGRRSIVTSLKQGDLFAEAFACAHVPELPVSVIATAPSQALFFSLERLLEGSRCFQQLQNVCASLLRIVARKNLALLRVSALLSRRTIRERVLGYLSSCAEQEGSREFAIPMDRQQMADFLAVDRSALSAELSRMKADGLIDFHKNRFVLKENT